MGLSWWPFVVPVWWIYHEDQLNDEVGLFNVEFELIRFTTMYKTKIAYHQWSNTLNQQIEAYFSANIYRRFVDLTFSHSKKKRINA